MAIAAATTLVGFLGEGGFRQGDQSMAGSASHITTKRGGIVRKRVKLLPSGPAGVRNRGEQDGIEVSREDKCLVKRPAGSGRPVGRGTPATPAATQTTFGCGHSLACPHPS